MKKIYILLFFLILLSPANIVYSQGGEGRSKPSEQPRSSKKEESKNSPKSASKKTPTVRKREIRKSTPNAPAPTKVLYAAFSVAVNEPNSEIFIADRDGNFFEDAESYITGEDGSPLRYDDFPTGTYTLTVRKDGFFDDKRQITVIGGRMNSFEVTLRPQAAFLSVSPNVEGASIEIENGGTYENQVDSLPLEPGTYRLIVSKNGYESQTREVVLNKVGERQNLSIILRVTPAAAVGKGEKRRIAVKIQINGQLSAGELIVERDAITIQAAGSNLSFIVTRGKADDFVESSDSAGSYIEFNAIGIFNSKPERNKRSVRLYPNPQDVKSTFQLMKSWRLGDFSK